MTLLHLGRK